MIFCYWHQNIHQIFMNIREQKLQNTEKNVNQSLKGRFTANELKCKYFWKGNKQLQIFWKGNRHNVPSLLKACLIFATKLFLSTSKLISLRERGYTVQKTLRGCTTNMGSKINLLVYEWSLIKLQNLVYEWVDFFKNWADWYMNWSLFLEKFVFVWVYFLILWQHIPTKTKIEYPLGISLH